MNETAQQGSSRKHDRLISLILSVTVTSAFLATTPQGLITANAGLDPARTISAVQNAGWPGTASIPRPVTIATPRQIAAHTPAESPGPLSAEQLQKIVNNLKERNNQITLDRDATNSLGLTKNGEALTLLHRGLRDNMGVIHTFFLLEGNAGYLLARRTPERITIFRLDTNLELISAIDATINQPDFRAVPHSEAVETMNAELLVWADIADHVIGAVLGAAKPWTPHVFRPVKAARAPGSGKKVEST